MNDKEMRERIKRFNEIMSIPEKAFMEQVIKYSDIGFGRMQQLIQQHWDIKLEQWHKEFRKQEPPSDTERGEK